MTFDERAAGRRDRGRGGGRPGAGRHGRADHEHAASCAGSPRRRQRLGCEFIQVSCPFYFTHTEEDFYEYVCEAADAADIGIIVYNTFWTCAGVSFGLVERLVERVPNVVGLKWACPRTDAMEFEDVVSHLLRAAHHHRQPSVLRA